MKVAIWFFAMIWFHLVRILYHQPAQHIKIYVWKLKFTYAREDRDNYRPITVAAQHLSLLRYDTIQGNGEKFHGLTANLGDSVGT